MPDSVLEEWPQGQLLAEPIVLYARRRAHAEAQEVQPGVAPTADRPGTHCVDPGVAACVLSFRDRVARPGEPTA